MVFDFVSLGKLRMKTGRFPEPRDNRISAETVRQDEGNRNYSYEYKDSEEEPSKYEAHSIQTVKSNSR